MARTAGAVAVPALVAQVARTTDPVLREARSPMDRIRSRVPGMSDDLLPRRDVLGTPIASESGVGPDIVSPLFTGTARNDPTLKALLDADVTISAPQRSYRAGGKRVEWSPRQYDALQDVTGRVARPQLDALARSPARPLARSPEWGWMSDDAKQDAVSGILKSSAAAGKAAANALPAR